MLTLPAVIEQFFAASNTQDRTAYLAAFAPDAVVTDDGRTHRGIDEIRAWRESVNAEFTYTAEPRSHEAEGSEHRVRATVEGTFPGSPVDLNYRFELRDDLIAQLTIAP